jgi:SET domain-containing protein
MRGHSQKDPPMSLHVRIGQASVGRGVFARREFPVREVIGRIHGAIIRDDAYESDYCMAIDAGSVLEPNAPFCYLNHSCTPNCAWFITDDPEGDFRRTDPQLLLYATRDIAAGDELTIDYAWPADVAVRCLCGSSDCRGWVVAAEELDDCPAR